MAKMTIAEMIARLPVDRQKAIHEKSARINVARANARSQEDRLSKEVAHTDVSPKTA